MTAYFVMQIYTKKGVQKMQAKEKEFKTGYSTSLKISTMRAIDEYSYKLRISKGEVGRKIIEYFIEHNDVEDLQE